MIWSLISEGNDRYHLFTIIVKINCGGPDGWEGASIMTNNANEENRVNFESILTKVIAEK
jgi:hypothetical protein